MGIVIKTRLDHSARDFPICSRCAGRSAQCRRGWRKFCGVSCAALHGSATRGCERDEHAGALGRRDGKRRGLQKSVEYFAASDDSADRDERDWRACGCFAVDQNACANFFEGLAVALARSDTLVRVRQTLDGAHFGEYLARCE